jgi:hypothetical protein
MTSSSITFSNSHSAPNRFGKLPVTSFPIHIALQIISLEHYFRICSNPQSTSNEVMILSLIIWCNPHSTSICSWKLPVTSFPIQIIIQNRSWQHSLTSVLIQIAPHIRSWQHPFRSVAMPVLAQICRENFLSHPFQSNMQFKFGHDKIISNLFLSTYLLKLGHDIIPCNLS